MSDRAAFFTTAQVAEMLCVNERTIRRWIRQGRIEGRLQFLGGTHLRYVFLCSEVNKFLDRLPTHQTLDDPKMLKLMKLRRLYIKKAAAARAAKKSDKARGEIV